MKIICSTVAAAAVSAAMAVQVGGSDVEVKF